MSVTTSHKETRDDYHGEIFRRGVFRVILCRDGIQWILQRQRPNFPLGGAAWDALGYFVTREALMRLYRAKSGGVAPELADLPARFGGECVQ